MQQTNLKQWLKNNWFKIIKIILILILLSLIWGINIGWVYCGWGHISLYQRFLAEKGLTKRICIPQFPIRISFNKLSDFNRIVAVIASVAVVAFILKFKKNSP